MVYSDSNESTGVNCVRCGRDTEICHDTNDTDCERSKNCFCDDAAACYGHCSGCCEPVDYCKTAGNCNEASNYIKSVTGMSYEE